MTLLIKEFFRITIAYLKFCKKKKNLKWDANYVE